MNLLDQAEKANSNGDSRGGQRHWLDALHCFPVDKLGETARIAKQRYTNHNASRKIEGLADLTMSTLLLGDIFLVTLEDKMYALAAPRDSKQCL